MCLVRMVLKLIKSNATSHTLPSAIWRTRTHIVVTTINDAIFISKLLAWAVVILFTQKGRHGAEQVDRVEICDCVILTVAGFLYGLSIC